MQKSHAPPGGTQSGIGINLAYSERYSDEMTAVVGEVPDPFNKVNFNAGLSGQLTPKLKWILAWNRDDIQADYDNSFPIEQAEFKYFTQLNRFSLNSQFDYRVVVSTSMLVFRKIKGFKAPIQ